MTETIGEIKRRKNLAFPDLVAENSLTYQLSTSIIQRRPTRIDENSQLKRPNSGQPSHSDLNDNNSLQKDGEIKIPSREELRKDLPPPLDLNAQEIYPINHVLARQISLPKVLLTPDKDQASNQKHFADSNRSSKADFLCEVMSSDASPGRKDILGYETIKSGKDDTPRDNVNLSVDYDDMKSVNSRLPSRHNSQIVAVHDYENFLKVAEGQSPRKSRFNNLLIYANSPGGNLNENALDESTASCDLKDSRKHSILSSVDKSKRSPKKSWNSLSILVKSIILLKNEEVKTIENVNEIQEELTAYKIRTRPQKVNPGKLHGEDALDEMRNIHLFCEYASNGSKNSLERMRELIEKDPKRNLLEKSDPTHFINRKNRFNQNALYLAAKNGNLNIVTFLIQQQADTHIESSPNGKGPLLEKPIHVAARWGHLEVLNFLIQNGNYFKKDLEKAYKTAEKPHIKEALSKYYSSKYKSKIRKLICGICGCL